MFKRFRHGMICRCISLFFMALVAVQADFVAALAAEAAPSSVTSFSHDSLSHVVPGVRIRVKATISAPAGIKLARCYFKASDETDYFFVAMQKLEGTETTYTAILPALSNNAKVIQYRFLAVNNFGLLAKTDEFASPVRPGVVPEWQYTDSRETIKVSTELDQAPQTASGFTDNIKVGAVESSSWFMLLSGVGVAAGL
ncbi:MAG: hypothetical protein PHD54_09500 [Desulfuromonadaceae bacterium]|nr:hypothetical protein [Desulfuromonadaceae bacterium]